MMDTERALEHLAAELAAVGRVDHLRDDRYARELADGIGRRQHLVAHRCALLPESRRLGTQHQVREVDVPLVRRHIRTLGHVAHVAQVTVVHDVPVDRLRHGVEFHAFRFVDRVEQRREGMAQVETATATVTNVEHPFEFLEQGLFVIEFVGLPVDRVTRGSLETALATNFGIGHGEKKAGLYARLSL